MTEPTSDAEVEELRARLRAGSWRHVVILTGAGISVASGLPTYRGPGGLWTRPGVEVPDAELFAREPSKLWSLFSPMRGDIRAAASTFTLLTQNVDGLHARAGSRNVVELHGCVISSWRSGPPGR